MGEVPSTDDQKHRLVLVFTEIGNNLAAAETALLLERFPKVKKIVLVGIAGGIPEHVRLGDIVVSNEKGIIQYDFNKETSNQVIDRHNPRPPDANLLKAAKYLDSTLLENDILSKIIDDAMSRLNITRLANYTDIRYTVNNKTNIPRSNDEQRVPDQPQVIFGPIASANKVLTNPKARDELAKKFHVIAVDMESAGVADAALKSNIGFLVVRGISDYCDEQKGDDWQPFAAVAAAAFTRALIESIPSLNRDICHSVNYNYMRDHIAGGFLLPQL